MEMGTSWRVWLTLLLFYKAGPGRAGAGAMELSRIVGGSVTFRLGIPAEQVRTVTWTVNATRIIVTVGAGNSPAVIVTDPSYVGRLRVPESNSLQITSLRMQDTGTYGAQISTATGIIQRPSLFLLRLYKQVPEPTVLCGPVTCENETCNYNLSCTIGDGGDNVTYSWTHTAGGAVVPNGSVLHVSPRPRDAPLNVTCTAQNPASNSSTTASAKGLCAGSLRNELLEYIVPIAIVGVLVFGAGIACWLRHRGQEEHLQQKEEKESYTIYSQVQRVEQQKSSRPPPVVKSSECTTIYVSATGLPPDPAQGEAPDHFKPFQAQEAATESLPQNLPPPMPPNPVLTTIYDIVMPATSPGNVQNCSRSGDTDGLFPCPQQKPISPAGRTFTHVHAKSHLAPQKRDKTPPCNSGWHNVSHPN